MSPPPKEKTNGDADSPVVLITGCSDGGIGSELAKALADGGARVIATARDVGKMSQLEGRRNVVALLPLDVADERSVADAAKRALELTDGKGCDVLVNNAGKTFKGTLLDADVGAVADLFDANVFGTLRATKALVPPMVRRGRGLIVNVGSATNYIYQSTKSAYSASKHAVRCFTDTLRVELSPFNVRCVLVSPGYVSTAIDDKGRDEGRWFAPLPGSPYAPPAGASESERGGHFRDINSTTRRSIFESGPGARGAMTPDAFSKKLAVALLREWRRTAPARGTVTRPPTLKEYVLSSAWLPTLVGGPLRHYRDAPFSTFTWFVGGFCPLWLQDFLMSFGGGLIERKR